MCPESCATSVDGLSEPSPLSLSVFLVDSPPPRSKAVLGPKQTEAQPPGPSPSRGSAQLGQRNMDKSSENPEMTGRNGSAGTRPGCLFLLYGALGGGEGGRGRQDLPLTLTLSQRHSSLTWEIIAPAASLRRTSSHPFLGRPKQ